MLLSVGLRIKLVVFSIGHLSLNQELIGNRSLMTIYICSSGFMIVNKVLYFCLSLLLRASN